MKNNLELLFTDTVFLNNDFFFKPEQQWSCVLGSYISNTNNYKHFAGIKTKDDFLLNLFIPENTFYLDYKIYDHDYKENETLDIYWKDTFYAWSFNKEKYQHLEDRQFVTRGKIIKQTSSHILLKIEKAIKFSKAQIDMYDKYKYLSIPKSYIFAINNIKANLKEVRFYVDVRIRRGVEDLALKKVEIQENNNILNGVINKDGNLNKNIFSITYFFQQKKYSMSYTGNIQDKTILEKYFLPK